MKTRQLIDAIAADSGSRTRPPSVIVPAALLAGAVPAAVLLVVWLGVRDDVWAALATVRFPFKFLVVAALAIPACLLLLRLARPGAPPGLPERALAAFPIVAGAGIAAELAALPGDAWLPALVGGNALVCLTVVPVLASAPLAALLVALRRAAPTRPGLAGAVAGLTAGAVAAFLYGWHCTDDSPLFVATWYTLAIGAVAAAGAGIGARLLRW
ncbi:MAG: NrsF family protein [Alphaproteobacteria bacterium]